MKKKGLADLLYPITVNSFLKSNWPSKPLFIPPKKNKLAFVLSNPLFANIETLLVNRPGNCTASLPDFNDEYSSLELGAKDALKAYRNGMTLTLANMQKQIPELHEWLWNVGQDLGLHIETEGLNLSGMRSLAYASPHGRGTNAHYDCNANFIVQVKGQKTWRLAPNESVEYPIIRHTCKTPVQGELLKHCKKTLPNKMPKNFTKVILKPGAVLFVPRGYWHDTLAEGESLSLNFTFAQPTWADVFSMAVKKKLSVNSDWRKLALDLGSTDTERKTNALSIYEKLLRGVIEELSPLKPEHYCLNTEYFCYKNIKIKTTSQSILIYKGSKLAVKFESSSEIIEILNWILKMKSGFSKENLRREFNHKSDVLTVNLLDQLEKAEVIRII